jgi:hypothetical protein
MSVIRSVVLLAILGLLLGGCGPDIAATSLHETLQTNPPQAPLMLTGAVSVDLPHGYSGDDLKPFSQWTQVGTLSEGIAYKQVARPYIVKAGAQYEAYLVVNNNALVGIYLPEVSAFVATDSPESMHLAVPR